MSARHLRRPRAAILSLALVSSIATTVLAEAPGDDLISIDQPTAFLLVMLDVIELAGCDHHGNEYFASTATGVVSYMSEKDARGGEKETVDEPVTDS
jgi:hypothetical protein